MIAKQPIMGFCAFSGSGKTTLMQQLIVHLTAQGVRVAAIKHAHHQADLDQPGKDSFRFRDAGATQVLLATKKRTALQIETQNPETEPTLESAVSMIDETQCDLILVEGFKAAPFPKIEIHRSELQHNLLAERDPHIVAVASDTALKLPKGVTALDLNNIASIAGFITEHAKTQRQTSHQIQVADNCNDPASSAASMEHLNATQAYLSQLIKPIVDTETVPLREAHRRILASDIPSTINVPNHTNSAMDGYALNSADLPINTTVQLSVVGKSLAGDQSNNIISKRECQRVMTGSILPAGADTVVMQENVKVLNESTIEIGSGHRQGQNVRYAGEDIKAGDVVINKGRRVSASDLGVLASTGSTHLPVYRKPVVAFASTGNELYGLSKALPPGGVYDSNRYTLYALIKQLGFIPIDLGVIPDDPNQLKNSLLAAAEKADVVITTGGASMGEADYIKSTLGEIGEVNTKIIAIKPGRPMAYGKIGSDCLFYGLPGNPVAVMVTFEQLVAPALKKLAGIDPKPPLLLQAVCLTDLHKKPGRIEFQRGIVEMSNTQQLQVRKAGKQGSGLMTVMSKANCYIVLEHERDVVSAGEVVMVQLFNEAFE